MSTNYNQLLKDLEIGSVYVKILICFLGCTFMLYPFLCYFTHFFRELSVYEQIFFTLGSSALYLLAQRTELEYLIYNDSLAYADLILNGEPEEYLKNVAGIHGLED